MLIMIAILVVVVIVSFIGILSRYRKCKSDEVLVVYGKTSGEKSAKLYHGGAAFVWPIIQGYEFLSMKPLQIDCKLTGALSAQNIRVDVPTTITVAISTDPEVMQNAAERLLGLLSEDKQNLITDVVYGQMRLVIADMTIEELNSDRDKFLSKVRSTKNENCIYELSPDHYEIKADETDRYGDRLRPHIVWFGEAAPMIEPAIEITEEAEIFVVTGTSLNVYPAAGLLRYVRPQVPIYLIDPKEVKVPVDRSVRVIQKGASEGVAELIALLRR